MTRDHRIEFPGTGFAPVEVAEGEELSLVLTAANSPLLFGCRSGICATCLVEVTALDPRREPPPAGGDEREVLDIYAPGNPRARLACQLELTAPVAITKLAPAD